jgi:small subunit ribosomal protein S20
LANCKSAKKRTRVNRARAERNKSVRSSTKTSIKKLRAVIESGDKDAAKTQLAATMKVIAMAGSKGVYHKNNVARKISSACKAVNKMA